MEFFFADDTTQKSSPKKMGNTLGFGGIFVPEKSLSNLEEKINAICKSFKIPDGEEIKWSPNKGSWIHKNLQGQERVNCYSEVLQTTVKEGCRALVVILDTSKTTLKGEAAFDEVIKYAIERIERHLKTNKSLGVIVADRPGGGQKQDTQFLAKSLDRIKNGTEYLKADHIPINILTTPSHLQRHLQVADLVTAITCAMVIGNKDYAKQYFPIIKKMLIKGDNGRIGGAGLKVFPDELTNLYHSLLGEQNT